jgi:hypothetical protein
VGFGETLGKRAGYSSKSSGLRGSPEVFGVFEAELSGKAEQG